MNNRKQLESGKWSFAFMMLLFSLVFTSFEAKAQVVLSDPGHGPKTIRMIKMKVDKNGQRTTIDTTFTQQGAVKGDSIPRVINVRVSKNKGHEKVMILKTDDQDGTFYNRPSANEPIEVIIQQGDSVGGSAMIKRIDVQNYDSKLMGGRCPMMKAPMGGRCPIMNGPMGGDPFAFNPRDNSVVSYKRRHRGNGLEKITIIRKRPTENNEEREIKVEAEVSKEVVK